MFEMTAERFVCNNDRCRFVWETPHGDCWSGQVCERCRAGKMREVSRCGTTNALTAAAS